MSVVRDEREEWRKGGKREGEMEGEVMIHGKGIPSI
jgi:hypothetical protein